MSAIRENWNADRCICVGLLKNDNKKCGKNAKNANLCIFLLTFSATRMYTNRKIME